MLLNRLSQGLRSSPFGSARPPVASRSIVCQAAAVETSAKKVHPSPLSQAAPSTYAIIEVGGMRQVVEEGSDYVTLKQHVQVRDGCASLLHTVPGAAITPPPAPSPDIDGMLCIGKQLEIWN